MQNGIEQFRTAMREAGLNPPQAIIADGKLHRFPSNGHPSDDAGWYVLHGDGLPAGAFGDWRSGLSRSWRADLGRRLSQSEEAAHKARTEAIRRAREGEETRRREQARKHAQALWEAAKVASKLHDYLLKKGVEPFGIREQDGTLLVPLFEGDELQNLQTIQADGEKRFLPGGKVSGCSFLYGKPGEVLCIAEGYATAASIHMATGYPVAVAFNAGNLPAVAKSLSIRFPAARLVVCADDDFLTHKNVGLAQARAAAREVGGWVAVPDFGQGRPDKATDFNDLHLLHGLDAVRDCVEKAVSSPAPEIEEPWPDPKPIQAELKPVPAFDADRLLPDALRPWILDEAERMACPPDYIAAAAVVALGALVGARCAMRPKALDSWLIVPNLWGGIVGEPSAKKSPAWGAALGPMNALMDAAQERYQEEMKDFEAKEIIFEAEAKAIEDGIKNAVKRPGKGDKQALAMQLRAHRDQTPKAPTPKRFRTNDTTVEKLGELLRENPNGILVLRDELVGLLATWDREGHEGDRAFFLEAWNGNQRYDTDRIGRGHIQIQNLCVSLFGGIQPDKLTDYLEQATHSLANDGLLQRFQILVYPDRRPWVWCDRAPDQSARAKAQAVFENLADFDPVSFGANPADQHSRFPYFRFDEAAQEIFIEWTSRLHRERLPLESEPIIQQHLSKYDKLFPALALLFHLVECGTKKTGGSVSATSAQRAADWCAYLEAHARRCYGLLMDEGLRAAQAMAGKLEQGALQNGFTPRDVSRYKWRYLTTGESVRSALDWLESEGWIRGQEQGGTGPGSGRPTVRYTIHPRIITRAMRKGTREIGPSDMGIAA